MRYLFIITFLLISLSPAFAAPKEPPLPSIAAVEKYLNSITTLKSRFAQMGNGGRQVIGTFWLKRPGRLRFEYDPPVKDFIVADGMMISYYDEQMKQQSSMPISKSLADFFLRKNMRLTGDVTVSDMRREDGLLKITVIQTRDPSAGELTIMLSEKPTLQLKKWRIVDAQESVTQVELYETQTALKLDPELFHYYDPQKKGSNINK